ncbi:hypothetical protein [Desulfofundulus sp.]|uniref:hypothetical protein n=1 Tax=Desulfofundulus sp. TaxID=2282750 RepID=UPI003C78743A
MEEFQRMVLAGREIANPSAETLRGLASHEELRRERRQWLARYRGLKPEIVAAIEPPGN